MSSRRARALCALAGVEALVAVGQRLSLGDLVGSYMLTNTAIGVGFASRGGIIAVQRPANRIGRPWIPGVRPTSIRERATELGGTRTAGPTPTGGQVVAVLPLAVPT